MVLAPRIEIKQSQKLMMTPQMQQAIQLLQLTNLQVTDMLKREMEQNPFLAFDAQHYRDRQGAAVQQAVKVSGTSGVGLGKEVEAVQVDFAADSQQDFGQQQADKSDTPLAAHLTRQIGEEMRDAAQAKLALELVGWLDEDGYLRESDAEICSTLGVPQEDLADVLHICQSFTPAGVFARNLADCLRLQLHADNMLSGAHAAVLQHLDLLGKGDFAALAEKAAITEDALPAILASIRALDPRPASAFDSSDSTVAQPDVIVLEGEGGWQAYLNDATLPRVLVLERDWEEMARRKITDEERAFMKANVQSARWLKKATQQRAATLLRVARAIAARQQGFFTQGMIALEPMVLRDIAETLELHESTVSRSAAGKLVQTAKGTFLLKDLFSTAVGAAKARGGSGQNNKTVSSAAIKARLLQLIADEEKLRPLSDEALLACLADEGMVVARRTIAKYRIALNIPSSAQRRRAAKIAAAAKKAAK
ncbi:MAG: RNA polymerase factor sigma-54 [Parvibaculales bacterium]